MIAVLSLVLAAAPAPALTEIPAPLGHFGAVVEAVPPNGFSDQDKAVVPKLEGCTPQAVFLMRWLSGSSRTLEQMQQWLDRTPGLEKKLFARKAVLAEVMKLLTDAKFEPKKSCAATPLVDGFKLDYAAPPKKFCDAAVDQALGEFWYFNKASPAAVVNVAKGDPDQCVMRVSSVLFDAKGVARLRVHADWGGQVSATLWGDKCQKVDFTLDKEKQSFVAALKSCKR